MNQLGKKGEDLAANYLIKKGYKILKKNYRFGHLEADIIAEFNNQIIFVEVKTRTSISSYDLLINPKKEQNLIELADNFMRENQINKEVRFDVIFILKSKNGYQINHIKSAFLPSF